MPASGSVRKATRVPRRRTQAQRSAATRRKLIRAALTCLYRVGYRATTTVMVAETAKVSRGAMLHHFRTKAELMLAVVEHVFHRQKRHYTRLLNRVPEGPERFLAFTDIAWRVERQAPSIAMLRALMAARSDEAMAPLLGPLAETIERDIYESVWQVARQAGIEDRGAIERMVRLHLAAIRGLSFDRMHGQNPDRLDEAVELLKSYKRDLMLRLTAG